jgi:apolipoprotein N-acyltransferase
VESNARRLAFRRRFAKLARLNRLFAQLRQQHRYLFAVLAGLLLAAAFPKINLAGAAWVAPALILACAYGKTGAAAWRIGYVAGLAHWLALLSWLLHIPVTGFPILGWIALAAFLAIYPATWVWFLTGRIGQGSWLRRCFWSLGGAAAWVALEMIRARLLSGFPWNAIGTSQWQMTPLIQLASVTGVYGISFLVVWVSLALYSSVQAMFRNPTTRYIWLSEVMLPVIVLMVVFNLGIARIRNAPRTDTSIRVTFVQPAVPQTMIWDTSENTNRFNQLLALTKTALASETDLLLWPEAALPELTEENYAVITNLIQQHRVWMMFNTDDVVASLQATPDAPYEVFNAAYLFNPEGQWSGVYHKRQLVIFGEYIPLVDALPFVKWFTPITGGYTSGRRINHFDITLPPALQHNSTNDAPSTDQTRRAPTRIRTAPLICFEDTFPHHVRDHVDADTDLLVNLTNDGWFGESAEQWQHLASAALRAVELGRPLLRCCNNGITSWFDAQGRMREIFRDPNGSEYGVGFATWEIPFTAAPARTATLYHRVGDRFGWTCVGVTAALLLWRFIRKPKL